MGYIFVKHDGSYTKPYITGKGENLKTFREKFRNEGTLHELASYIKFFNNGKVTEPMPFKYSQRDKFWSTVAGW